MEQYVVAFDPGFATGWSRWQCHSDRMLERIDYGLITDGLDGFTEWCLEHPRYLAESIVISEGFIPQSLAVEWRTPIRIEGAMSAFCAAYATPPPIFQPRNAKHAVADDLLKRHGLWLAGNDPKIAWQDARDVNDSQLHALAWAKHDGHLPTIRALWPDE